MSKVFGPETQYLCVKSGDPFVIELPVKATAGYDWEIYRLPGFVTLRDERTSPKSNIPGASAIREFEFEGIHPGRGSLVMHCRRSWEQKVAERLEVTIVVE